MERKGLFLCHERKNRNALTACTNTRPQLARISTEELSANRSIRLKAAQTQRKRQMNTELPERFPRAQGRPARQWRAVLQGGRGAGWKRTKAIRVRKYI